MAATKYQILYRYTNPNSNQFITNDSNSEYNPILEFYHEKHKMVVGKPEEQLEANNEASQLIIDGNNMSNDNYNMLFKFTGTKRKNKKVWVESSIGYVVRDTEAVRKLTTRAVDGNYNGQYLLIEGTTLENGVVVAKSNLSKSVTVATDSSQAANRLFYTKEEMQNLIMNSTIYKLKNLEISTYATASNSVMLDKYYTGNSYSYSNPVYQGPIFIDEEPIRRTGNYMTSNFCVLMKENSATAITVKPDDVETYEIPAHYEEVADYPYYICDTYDKIEQSPWFILSTHASLPSALEKAEMIIKAVGIENVKMIKVVPTDQFIKIK